MRKVVTNPVVGKVVTRWLAGKMPMDMKITEVTDDLIVCGDWTFHRITGAEIDEYLGWGPLPLMTGSFLTEKE